MAGDLFDRASLTPAPARDHLAVCRYRHLKAKPAAGSDPRPVVASVFAEQLSPPAKRLVRLDIDVLGFRQEEEADDRGDRCEDDRIPETRIDIAGRGHDREGGGGQQSAEPAVA